MVCDICGKEGVRERRMTKTYGKGKSMFMIENIPVLNCPHCDELYMKAETLHELERLKLHRDSIAIERTVKVVNFG